MELITINRLELASNLALKQVCLNNDIQEDELFDTAENGDKNIKEYYQDEFNDLYDDYLDMINECREDREITPTRMAEIMKANLIEMALNDRLPQDLNELDINDLVGDMNFVLEEMPPVPEFFEAKRFPVEFEFDGEFYSFDIHPTQPEWNTSIEIEDDVFNILYSEENNLVRVFRQDEMLSYFEELVASIPIKKEEQKSFRVEFWWKVLRSFDIHPDEPDWWTSIKLENDTFDIHYCEDYNQVCVYLVYENIPRYKEAVACIPIRKEESNA